MGTKKEPATHEGMKRTLLYQECDTYQTLSG